MNRTLNQKIYNMGNFGASNQNKIKEEHERQFNLFYLAMYQPNKKGRLTSKKEDNFDFSKVVNIALYDINNAKTSYLFPEGSKTDIITEFIYEVDYDSKIERMNFNKSNSHIVNNESIAERDPHNKLVVCQTCEDKGTKKIWSFTKQGENKTLIAEIDNQTAWRMDVFNKKLITFKRALNAIEFKDYNY